MLQEEDSFGDDGHVEAFTRIWVNEANAPGLLPYAAETVDCIVELVNNQKCLLSTMSTSTINSPDNVFRRRLCELELSRIAYQLSAYFRVRVQKILKHAYFYSQYKRSLLSPAETMLLDGFRGAFEEDLLHSNVTSLPFPSEDQTAGSANYDDPIIDVHPEEGNNEHVIIRVRADAVEQYQLDPTAPHMLHDLVKDDIILMPYKTAKKLILDETAECL